MRALVRNFFIIYLHTESLLDPYQISLSPTIFLFHSLPIPFSLAFAHSLHLFLSPFIFLSHKLCLSLFRTFSSSLSLALSLSFVHSPYHRFSLIFLNLLLDLSLSLFQHLCFNHSLPISLIFLSILFIVSIHRRSI